MKCCTKLNIYVGDQDYMMDAVLRFKNPMTFMRYQKDFITRAKQITLCLLLFSAVSLAMHLKAIYRVYHSTFAAIVIFVFGIALHITAYNFVIGKHHVFSLRIVFSFLSMLNKIIVICESNKVANIFSNFFTISSSTLLATPWYYHAAIEFTEYLIVSIIKPGNIMHLLDSFYLFTISTVIVGCIERFNKENWVLKDTFKSSYLTFKSIVDHIPQSMVVLDKQGNIMYSNKFANESILVNCATTMHNKRVKLQKRSSKRVKLSMSVQEAQRKEFEQWLEESFKSKAITNITIPIERKVDNSTAFEDSVFILNHCKWKKINAAVITSTSIAQSRKAYTCLHNEAKSLHGIITSLAYELERIYMDERRKQQKLKPIIEKINRIVPKLESHRWYLMKEAKLSEKNIQHFDIISLFTYCIDNIVGSAFEKGITTSLSIEEGLPVDLDGDLNLFKDVIMSIMEIIIATVEKVHIYIRCETKDLSNSCNLSFNFTTKTNYEVLNAVFTKAREPDSKYSFSLVNLKEIIAYLGGSIEVVGNDEEVSIIFRQHFDIVEGNKSIFMNKLELVKNKIEKDIRHIEWDPKIEPKVDANIDNNKIKSELSKLKLKQNANQNSNANSDKYHCIVEKNKAGKELSDDKKEERKKGNSNAAAYFYTQPKEEDSKDSTKPLNLSNHHFNNQPADNSPIMAFKIYDRPEEIKTPKGDTQISHKISFSEKPVITNDEFTRNIEEHANDEFLTEKLPTSCIFSPSYSPCVKLISKMLLPLSIAGNDKDNDLKRNDTSYSLPVVIQLRPSLNNLNQRTTEYCNKIGTIYSTKYWGSILQDVKVDDVVSQKILIVDDNEFIRETISKIILKNYSRVDIDIAKDGEMAVQKYKLTTKEGQKYIVIFMDIIMPNMDGIEATQEIRKYEAAHSKEHTSIFGLSAPGNPNQVEECKACGMDDLLYKPISHESMCKVLKDKINSK